MKQLAEKLRDIEIEISKEKGQFTLFALFLREDMPNVWDIVVSAPWIDKDQDKNLRYLANKIFPKLPEEDLIHLTRIVILEEDHPAVPSLLQAVQVKHGVAEISNCNFFGLKIQHAFLITTGSTKSHQ